MPGARSLLQPRTPPDPRTFADLYAQGFQAVWRLLRRLGVPASALEDATHDVFVIAWRRLDDFQGRSALRTWLLGIAVRVASDVRRRQRLLEPLPEELRSQDNPERQAHQREAGRQVLALLERLRPERREVFVLMDLEEYRARRGRRGARAESQHRLHAAPCRAAGLQPAGCSAAEVAP